VPKWLPERPLYRRERLLVGYPVLAVFLLLFLSRLLSKLLSLSGSLSFSLLCVVLSFLIPSAVFWLLRGSGYTGALRLRAPRAAQLPFLIFAFFMLLSGAMLLSILCKGTSSLGNSATAFEAAEAGGFWRVIGMGVVLAVLPALLEEFFFRGIVALEYERRGAIRAVLMSALLFALCHFDIHNLPVYLFSGALFTLVLFATDSLIATMLLHVVYNVVSLFGQRYLNALYDFTGSLELFIFLLVLLFLVSAIFFTHTGA
jgi:membrane protease YdiL (CAAX protease family)